MLEQFDSRARRAVVLAQREARLLCHTEADIDHLLLTLFAEEDSAISILFKRYGVTYDSAYRAVEDRHPAGTEPVQGDISFTAQLKIAVQTARNMARSTDGDKAIVQDLHLLLSLFCIDDTAVPEILAQLDCNQNALRNSLARLLGLPTPFTADTYRLPDNAQQ